MEVIVEKDGAPTTLLHPKAEFDGPRYLSVQTGIGALHSAKGPDNGEALTHSLY